MNDIEEAADHAQVLAMLEAHVQAGGGGGQSGS
jgi:hypothetical protein